jgi:endonuclease G
MPYDPTFIGGEVVEMPAMSPRVHATAFNGGLPVEHSRFSIVFSQERGFAIFTAHNIDGSTIIPAGTIARTDSFRFDSKVPRQLQVDNDRGYRGRENPWDRGHLVRRRSLHWGDEVEARAADRDSYFWTNIVPQHERLHDTAWGDIEDFMFDVADSADKRACVFQGPVLTPDDPVHTNRPGELPIQIPAGFWKIFSISHGGMLRAACFLVWQRDYDDLNLSFDPILEQVRITTIEFLTGLVFSTAVRRADALRYATAGAVPATPAGAGATGTPTSRRRVTLRPGGAIMSPSDIFL